MSKKLVLVLGIRPDVIRCAILIRILKAELGDKFVFIWSGQHYSDNLKDIFFRELEVPLPDITFELDTSSDTKTIASLSVQIDEFLKSNEVAAVVYLGDTNTVASSIACAANNIPIVHIEGCMRSYDWRMPEEKFRTQIDHLADVIYAYLDEYKSQGIAEGIPESRIVTTGNPIVDVLNEYFLSGKIRMNPAEKRNLFEKYGIKEKDYVVMTCHRRENIENEENLQRILELISKIDKKVFFPAGYRTQKQLKLFNLSLPANVILVDPIGYQELLELMYSSAFTITDSGTIVEEASILGIPTIQMRTSTERPQVYDVGGSIKFDPSMKSNSTMLTETIHSVLSIIGKEWNHILGDGQASKRIAEDLVKRLASDDFRGHKPDFSSTQVARNFGEGILDK